MDNAENTPTCATEESRRFDYLRENREAIIAQYIERISAENLTQKELIERLAFTEWLLDMKSAENELLKSNYMPQESRDELVSMTAEYSSYETLKIANERHSPTKDKTAALDEIGEEYIRRVESGETHDDKGRKWRGKGTAAPCLADQFKQHAKYWANDKEKYIAAIARRRKDKAYPSINTPS